MSDTAHTTPATGRIPAARAETEQRPAPPVTREALKGSPLLDHLPGIAAGIAVLVGFFAFVLIPGGGTTAEQTVVDYYGSAGSRALASALAMVLIVGCVLMMWFFTELRDRLPSTRLTRLGYVLAVVGASLVAAGIAVALGPTGVQTYSELPFVGVAVAVTMVQAGLALAIFGGIYLIGAALVLLCLAARRAGAVLAPWLAVSGIVVGVLLVGSVIGLPAVLLPLWLIVAGAVGLRSARA